MKRRRSARMMTKTIRNLVVVGNASVVFVTGVVTSIPSRVSQSLPSWLLRAGNNRKRQVSIDRHAVSLKDRHARNWLGFTSTFSKLRRLLLFHHHLFGIFPNSYGTGHMDIETANHSQLRNLDADIDQMEKLDRNAFLFLSKKEYCAFWKDHVGN